MKVEFRRSFVRDIKRIREGNLKKRLMRVIRDLEKAKSLDEIPGLAPLRGAQGYYRIRVGAYRLGLIARQEKVILVRFLHRREIYRYFP